MLNYNYEERRQEIERNWDQAINEHLFWRK